MQMSGHQILEKEEYKGNMTKSTTMGLQCTIGRFQTQSAIWKFSEENQCSKAKGWIDFFS